MPDLTTMKPSLTFVIDTIPIQMPPPSLATLVTVQQWINRQPSPREQMRALLEDMPADTPAEVRARIATEAVERSANWPPKFGSLEANMLLTEMEGVLALATAMIRTGQPNITIERAEELAGRLSPEVLGDILDVAFGKAEEEGAGPKSGSGDDTSTSTPPTPSTGP